MIDAIAIVCTRLESRRLPGKATMIFEGLTSLDHIILRLQETEIQTFLAVPTGQYAAFSQFAQNYPDVRLWEGNEESPLHRMADLVRSLPQRPKFVVRITHDDILIDVKTVQELLDLCEREGSGYGISPGIVDGAGVEVISVANLLHAADKREEPTEFVTYFVRGEGVPNPKVSRLDPRPTVKRNYRLTIDYPKDALLMRILMRQLGPMPRLETVCSYLDQRPYLLNINRMPDVTFYTCVKDMEDWVGDTMLSVLNSGVPNLEYIVVDDGSKDRTLEEVAKFSGDPRLLIVVNDRNFGLATSSNVAVSHAMGKYVVRVDGDDLLLPSFRDHWASMTGLMEAAESDVLYPAYAEVNQYGGLERSACNPGKTHHAGCAVIRRGFLNELKFREGLRHWDSLELYERARKATEVTYWDDPVWQYRIRKDSMSRSGGPEREEALKAIRGDAT